MGFGLIFIVLIIGLIIYVVVGRPDLLKQISSQKGHTQSSLEILKNRYARGEITKEEYDRTRRDLEQ